MIIHIMIIVIIIIITITPAASSLFRSSRTRSPFSSSINIINIIIMNKLINLYDNLYDN